MRQRSWGLVRPADDGCGTFGFWVDPVKGRALTCLLFVSWSCGWVWGFERFPSVDYFAVGLGPIFKIVWS